MNIRTAGTLLVVAACGGSSEPTSTTFRFTPSSIAGTYALQTVDGAPLPYSYGLVGLGYPYPRDSESLIAARVLLEPSEVFGKGALLVRRYRFRALSAGPRGLYDGGLAAADVP